MIKSLGQVERPIERVTYSNHADRFERPLPLNQQLIQTVQRNELKNLRNVTVLAAKPRLVDMNGKLVSLQPKIEFLGGDGKSQNFSS